MNRTKYKFHSGFIDDNYRIRAFFSESEVEFLIKAYKYPGNKKVAEIKFPMEEAPTWNIACQCFDLSDHDETTLDIVTERLLESLKAREKKE